MMNRITKKLEWRECRGEYPSFDAYSPLETVNYYSVGPLPVTEAWYAKAEHGRRLEGPEETWFGTAFPTREAAMEACENHYENAFRDLMEPEALDKATHE